MDRLFQSQCNQQSVAALSIAQETEQMAIDDSSTDRLLSPECTSFLTEGKDNLLSLRETPVMYQTKQLKYLAQSYERTLIEEKNYPKVSWRTVQ